MCLLVASKVFLGLECFPTSADLSLPRLFDFILIVRPFVATRLVSAVISEVRSCQLTGDQLYWQA